MNCNVPFIVQLNISRGIEKYVHTYFSQEIRRLLIIFLYMVRNLNSNWAVFKSNWKMCPCRVLVSFVTRSLFKGRSIYYVSIRSGWLGGWVGGLVQKVSVFAGFQYYNYAHIKAIEGLGTI